MPQKVISLSVEDWYVTFAHQTSRLMAFIALASKKSLFNLRSLNVFKMDLSNKVATELRVVSVWSKSTRFQRAAPRLFDSEISGMI